MQPYHAIDDGRWAEKVIGHERSMTTYAFKSLTRRQGKSCIWKRLVCSATNTT